MGPTTLKWDMKTDRSVNGGQGAEVHVHRVFLGGAPWAILVDEKIRHKTSFAPSPHEHTAWDELIVPLDGRYWVKSGEWQRTLAPGEAALIPGGVGHDSGIASNLPGTWFLVLLMAADIGILRGIPPGGVTLPRGATGWLAGAFRFLRHEPTTLALHALHALPEFMRELTKLPRLGSDATHPDPLVAKLLPLLEQMETPRLAELAGFAGLSPAHLQKRFAQALGCSPLQYALAWRLDAAAALLRQNAKVPVIDIAADCGFNDGKHFRTVFRRRFGLGPLAYRKNPPPSTI